jgi:hypothetical protein
VSDWLWFGFWVIVGLAMLTLAVLVITGMTVFFWPGEVTP